MGDEDIESVSGVDADDSRNPGTEFDSIVIESVAIGYQFRDVFVALDKSICYVFGNRGLSWREEFWCGHCAPGRGFHCP